MDCSLLAYLKLPARAGYEANSIEYPWKDPVRVWVPAAGVSGTVSFTLSAVMPTTARQSVGKVKIIMAGMRLVLL
jgi:hypothetical protein